MLFMSDNATYATLTRAKVADDSSDPFYKRAWSFTAAAEVWRAALDATEGQPAARRRAPLSWRVVRLGVELLRDGELYAGRRYPFHRDALAFADEERRALEQSGSTLIDGPPPAKVDPEI
jgi:hypothetical protein